MPTLVERLTTAVASGEASAATMATQVTNLTTAVTAAAASATAAAASEDAVAASATAAATSAAASETARLAAVAAQTAAETARTAAQAAQSAAETAQAAALVSQAAAAVSAANAGTSATNAATSATAAATSATAAATAQGLAEAARDAAVTARNAAQTAQTAAETAQAAALASQTAAASSATAAAGSATTATTQATASAASAAAAATSATNAATSATAAATSATNSANSATASAASATAAAASAAAAATSETNAGTSATAAATAKTAAENSATAAAASAASAAAVGISLAAPYLSKAPRGGVISTGAGPVGTTQDNTGLATGTANRSGWAWIRLPDYTPAANVPLYAKFASNLGTKIWLLTSGKLRLEYGNGSNFTTYRFDSSVAVTATDGAWHFLAWTEDRTGNLIWYWDGSAVGTATAISGASAQTITNTGTLNWFSDGTTHTVGTLGECGTIVGLFTATQVANIYQAGTIAPFAVSFTFRQWLDFGQGYGPIIKDLSSLAQSATMGTTGLTHAVSAAAPGRPCAAPTCAIVSDGNIVNSIGAAIGIQDPQTEDFVLWWHGIFPTDAVSTQNVLAYLGSVNTGPFNARGFVITYDSAAGILVTVFGASTGDYNRRGSGASLISALAGKECVIAVTRTDTYIGIGGDWFKMSFLESTLGTPPLWTGQVIGTYLMGFLRGTSVGTNQALHDLRLANFAMTEAQLSAEYQRGEPSPQWQWASSLNKFPSGSALSLGAGDANVAPAGNPNGTTWAIVAGARTGGAGAYYHNITNASGSADWLYWSLAMGNMRACRVRCWARLNSALGGGATGFTVHIRNQTSSLGSTVPARQFPTNAWAQYTFIVTCNAPLVVSAGLLYFSAVFGAAFDFDIDDVEVEVIGWSSRLGTDTAAGLTALDRSSNKNDFLMSTTGITTSPNGRTQIIRAQTTTNGNQQLAGASVIDTTKRWRIRSWNISSSGTPTVSLGSVSAGAQYVSAKVLTATDNNVTDAQFVTRVPATANLWCNSNSTATLDHTIILDEVD